MSCDWRNGCCGPQDCRLILRRRSLAGAPSTSFSLPAGFTWKLWRPRILCFKPPQVRFSLRLLYSYCRWLVALGNRPFRALVILAPDGRMAHVSYAFGMDFKHRYMKAGDVIISRMFTNTRYRGRGLARFAVQELLRSLAGKPATCWYLTKRCNVASIAVAEANGFRLDSSGQWVKFLGVEWTKVYIPLGDDT